MLFLLILFFILFIGLVLAAQSSKMRPTKNVSQSDLLKLQSELAVANQAIVSLSNKIEELSQPQPVEEVAIEKAEPLGYPGDFTLVLSSWICVFLLLSKFFPQILNYLGLS